MIQKSFKIYSLKNFFLIFSLYLFAISMGSCSGGGSGGDSRGGLYSTSSTVTSGSSILAGVTMTLAGMSSSIKTTDSNGTYQFTDLAGGSYTITPSRAGFTFNPASITVSVTNSNVPGQNFAATGVTWAKTYGGSSTDSARSIQQTLDGGFILAGETSSFGSNTDVWVLKLDVNGNIGWQKSYGGNGVDIAHSIQQTSDGGYIIAGESNSFGGGDKDIWVLRLTSIGGIQWQKIYGANTTEDSAYSVQQTSDGEFIIAGETISGRPDVWILKLDSRGAIQWEKTYGGIVNNSATSIRQTYDGGQIVAGTTTSFGGNANFWVLKLMIS